MSIREQVEDAKFLAEHGRYLGAFTILMLAIAASSRRTFPKPIKSFKKPNDEMKSVEAFTLFLSGRIRQILSIDFISDRVYETSGISVPFRQRQYDLAYIIYKFYRCELVHDGELPEDVVFGLSDSGFPSGVTISNGNFRVSVGTTDNKVLLSCGWIELFCQCVVKAPCNGNEFGIVYYKLIPKDGDEKAFLENLVNKYKTSMGRVDILKHAIRKLSPTSVLEGTDEIVVAHFRDLVASSEIHGSAITALSSHAFTDQNGELQQLGISLLREIARGYKGIKVS